MFNVKTKEREEYLTEERLVRFKFKFLSKFLGQFLSQP